MTYKLVCFDLDGTIIDETVSIWQTIHDHLQTDQKEREKNRQDFKNNKISYDEWARLDIEMWKDIGATRQDILDALEPLKLMKGARETLLKLKESGLRLIVISGSLNMVLEKVFPDFRDFFDHVFINNIFFDSNHKIKEVVSTLYDKGNKGDALKLIAKNEKISLEETVFVGDNANDVDAAKIAGKSIAFNPQCKEIEEASEIVIKENNLEKILPHILTT